MSKSTLEYITRLSDHLSAEEKLNLVEHLARSLRMPDTGERKEPKDLYGVWKGRIASDFDIDSALYEIRHEWEKEWPENFKQ
ncbi:MAG: hypothetical protein L0229_00190 [Blastocatellia bacterium]|nr:hypothetical protein [Blastocatellia bacterium]